MANTRRAGKIRCIETGEMYNSYREASKATGVSHTSINAVVLGKQESAKGLHFEFVEEEEQIISCITNEQGEPVPVIDSREVARMMGKTHKEILWYIEGKVINEKQVTGILPTLQGNN